MVSFVGQAQIDLSDYKYIVVPKRFNGFKKENQYQTSTLVKHLLTKKGFLTVYEDDLPNDLNSNRCLGLYIDLIDSSSLFTTKTSLALKDCESQEVFISEEGKSKHKEYKQAFSEAIKGAFDSFGPLTYSYNPKATTEQQEQPITISFKNDIKTVEEKPIAIKKETAMVEQVATQETQSYKDKTPVASNFKKGKDDKMEMGTQKATKEEQSYKDSTPIQSDLKKESTVTSAKETIGVLYAQELPNGYQLVDSTPKIQLKIYKSSMPNVYIAQADDKDGVVYTSDGKWFFEYYEGDKVMVEELEIKF